MAKQMKPLKEIRAAKASKEKDLLDLPGVTGVDVGRKVVNGKRTDEIAIRVFVQKKKKNVPAKDRVPEEINGIPTDVIEATFELHTASRPVAELVRQADTGTYNPLVGGISIGPCTAVDGFVYTGTLGCMVQDRTTNEPLMLTNYHVIAEKWAVGEQICQPSRVDTGSCPSDVAGALVRSVLSDKVDGAVASISGRTHNCTIEEIGAIQGKAVAVLNEAVRKRGRTTGFTHGIVDSIDATVTVPYDDGSHILTDQIIITVDEAQSEQFGNSGDSGSVVVNANDEVIGLYFAGTPDGGLGVANPIDAVLDELNVDLCTNIVKPPYLEDLKWIFRDDWKNIIKEVFAEKPPFAEWLDWGGNWRINPPWLGRGQGNWQGSPTTHQGPSASSHQPMMSPLGPVCIDFGSVAPGVYPNPYVASGATFRVFDYTNAPVANTRIVSYGGLPGLDANYTTIVTHAPCNKVELTVIIYATPPTIRAFDASNQLVATAIASGPQGTEQTFTLSGQSDIVRVEIDAPQNEVILRRYCHCLRITKPIKEKFESKEKLEFKEKVEVKEYKEFKEKEKEIKEYKEKDLKEKDLKDFKETDKEIYEFKQREKGIEYKGKEQKEYKQKDFKELEKPLGEKGSKESEKPFEDFPGRFQGQAPGPQDQSGIASLEARLARIEAMLGQSHFIGEQLRPDLSQGALRNEPGYRR